MEEIHIIPLENICAGYGIPASFVADLEEINLIEVETRGTVKYLHITHIQTLEKLIRLHYDLNINLEGLDVVNNLLDQVNRLREENLMLRNRLKRFE